MKQNCTIMEEKIGSWHLCFAFFKLDGWQRNRLEGIIQSRPNKSTENDILAVETFFKKNGYDIDIIGAHTNGREHEGPFSYGWSWHSFELGEKGEEVIMLYHYSGIEMIEEYLEELNDDTRKKCYISEHFVFYYSGEVEDITNMIIEFCESKSIALREWKNEKDI